MAASVGIGGIVWGWINLRDNRNIRLAVVALVCGCLLWACVLTVFLPLLYFLSAHRHRCRSS
jgi:hypothetical protein